MFTQSTCTQVMHLSCDLIAGRLRSVNLDRITSKYKPQQLIAVTMTHLSHARRQSKLQLLLRVNTSCCLVKRPRITPAPQSSVADCPRSNCASLQPENVLLSQQDFVGVSALQDLRTSNIRQYTHRLAKGLAKHVG